ncbi:hypothetical protein [Sphingomonas sp.]|uniref:hypothetical protein n=1 Tax=Sphingomonas sp. TaxID=28214 RepID=UPI003D6D64A0
MRYIAIVSALPFVTVACAHASQINTTHPTVCSSTYEGNSDLINIDILVVSDQHGSVATIKSCPDRSFSIDFSDSNLFTKQYSPLLDKIQLDSVRGGNPIEMQITGLLRKSTGSEVRDTIMVRYIGKYQFN